MSGETKFTSGPWRIEPPHNHEGGDGFSILREDLHEVEWVAEVGWEADAHLIAASPELYAALDECCDMLVRIVEGKEWGAIEEQIDDAQAALAKARGESQ